MIRAKNTFAVTSGKAASRGRFFKVEKILLRTDKQENYAEMKEGSIDEEERILIQNQALIKVHTEYST